MKLAPTLEGGLRIDADAVEDWMVLDGSVQMLQECLVSLCMIGFLKK